MKKIIKSLGLMSLVLAVVAIGFGANFAQAVTYTPSDIASHNTQADCWVIVNNNVYNLTSFIPLHSGGQAAIIAQCGKDGTVAFNNGPHNSNTLNAIAPYIIGTLGTTVTINPILTSVVVSPNNSSITVGGTKQLIATPEDQNNVSFAGATTTFSSSNNAVATVNSTTGLVTGVSLGSVTITTTSVSGNITVTTTSTVTVSTNVVVGNNHDNESLNENDNETEGLGEDGNQNEISMSGENENKHSNIQNNNISYVNNHSEHGNQNKGENND